MYGALRELRNITINKGKNKEKEKEKDKDKEKDGVNLDVIVKD